MQYYKNNNVRLLLNPILIKYLPEETKVICLIIDPSIKKGDCSDTWNFVTLHVENESYQIQGIYFDQYYSPVAHTDSSRINSTIAAMHKLTARFLDIINEFRFTNVPINEIVYISPPIYHLDWFETIFLKYVNGI